MRVRTGERPGQAGRVELDASGEDLRKGERHVVGTQPHVGIGTGHQRGGRIYFYHGLHIFLFGFLHRIRSSFMWMNLTGRMPRRAMLATHNNSGGWLFLA